MPYALLPYGLFNPVGDVLHHFGRHCFLYLGVFGWQACRAVLEKMVQFVVFFYEVEAVWGQQAAYGREVAGGCHLGVLASVDGHHGALH